MEQQMALYVEIDDLQTGEKTRSPLIPLTDAVMDLLDSTSAPGAYDKAHALVKRYGVKLGQAVDRGTLDVNTMCRMLAVLADGIAELSGFNEYQAECLRNAAHAAADVVSHDTRSVGTC